MPVYRLGAEPLFPDPEDSDDSGLLAVGGDLEPQRLLTAYACGIFPWYSDGQPILWHSPDPRALLVPSALHVPRSLRRTLRRGRYALRLDSAFAEVVRACAEAPRPEQDGTWITAEMQSAYLRLHELGFAHSAEAWEEGALVGGVYGVSLGGAFFAESMFARRNDASKAALVVLVEQLARWDFDLFDCQIPSDHVARFGARPMARRAFLELLRASLARDTRRGPWSLDALGAR